MFPSFKGALPSKVHSPDDTEARCGVHGSKSLGFSCTDASSSRVKTEQAALEANIFPTSRAKVTDQSVTLLAGRTASVNLKQALEACLFGAGMSDGQGLLDAVETDGAEILFIARPSAAESAASAGGMHPSGALSPPPRPLQANALMRGLVEEGVRIRDLLLALMSIHRGRGMQSPLAGPTGQVEHESPSWRDGAQAVAAVQSACNFRRRLVGVLLGTFVEWLADTPWVWGATEGMEGEDWEGDFAAAALAIFVAFPYPLPDAGRGMCSATSPQQSRASVGEPCGDELVGNGGDLVGERSWGSERSVAPEDVLDRLVGGVAAAMQRADADKVEWVDVLRRVTAAPAATASLKAYAVACVEKSAALGGQAPFRVSGKRRFSQVGGRELWDLLEGVCLFGDERSPGDRSLSTVMVRTAAAAVTTCRKLRYEADYRTRFFLCRHSPESVSVTNITDERDQFAE